MSYALPLQGPRPLLPRATLARWTRATVLQAGVFAVAWVALVDVTSASRVPVLCPAAALVAGLHLTSPRTWRPWLECGSFAVLVLAHSLQGYPVVLAAGFSASSVAAACVTSRMLTRTRGHQRVTLISEGDVSRMIGSVAAGSAAAAVGYAATCAATGTGHLALAAVAAFGAHAAAMMMLLPLFLRTTRFAPLAGPRERVTQSAILVGTTVVVFAIADAPPVIFAVMPMFAWLAFRGTLREATVLLSVVGVIGTGLTALRIGPIWDVTQRYGIAPELSGGVLQLFLLDCGLILLPLSVMATQQRTSAARAAAEQEKLERLVALASGTAVIATAMDGRVVIFNPAAEAILGIRREDVVDQQPEAFLSRLELARHATRLGVEPTFAAICRASVETDDTGRLWWFQRPDGENRTMRMTLTAVPDEHGLPSGYLATAEDVTEREAAHQALLHTLDCERAASDRLRELERVKADLVATVSHELRTPITSILGYLELLDAGDVGGLNDAQQRLVERVNRNSRRLLLLVEDLLTLSQVESARLSMDTVPADLRQIVSAAHDAVAPLLDRRSLEVVIEVPDVPVPHEVDPVQMERMLVNLLTNAVKFTPDGGSIALVLSAGDDADTMVVSDTGLGIPVAEQDHLFTKFFRSSTATKQAIQGTGLGLTIVKAIVAQHHGTITVDSTPGRGTTFTVTLPHTAVVVDGMLVAAPVSTDVA